MRKNRAIILILLLLTFCTTYGQTNKFEFGIEGGPSLISLRGNDIIDQYQNPTIGFSGGPFFQYNFKKIISLRTNLAFERKGSTAKTQAFDEYGNSLGNVRTNSNFDYLTLPILVRATFGKRILFFVNTGPYIGFLLKETSVSKGDKVPKKVMDFTSLQKRNDFGVSAGLGLLVPFKQNIAFSFELRNNLGVYNVDAGHVINGGQIKTNSTNFLFGFVYKFGFQSTVKTQL
ncbi:hypothetical protein AQPE_4878 [Aquipluma nitroreducens]|uniref:Outer membrane protein beta-barrel domain-containing protein n=1 Tax=Aquipluma nitroreducens TaxID=2010828 RepID=A0A5K7SHC0_9BACT|nr:porin family protein [Aquipluma nitroreducens]BBE20684.1 hypothetical protein AQPE_4878 [Aquipluma nitroreducens]